MDAWIYCVIILIRCSLCFWEKTGETQSICIYIYICVCVCVCVTLQSHHTETMLRCGLPSEKDEGRKVSSDFVRLFSGKHAATVQCGCMWYYNYAMYILQCVIILHKTTACGFSSNEGGCCWVKKTGESGRRLKRSSARLHHADAPTYVNSYEVSEVEDT